MVWLFGALGAAVGRRFLHGPSWTARYCAVLYPICDSVDLSNTPLLLGSGNFGSPWARMQRANARARVAGAEAAGALEGVLAVVVTALSRATEAPDEPPLQATRSRAIGASNATANATRRPSGRFMEATLRRSR